MAFGDHTCVFGLQWGDEGKGKVVDFLMEEHGVVARYAGGANAGHTIVVGENKFALHQVPSGIIRPDVTCVLGCGMVIDPAILLSELRALADRNITATGRLWLSSRAHLVLPYHRSEDTLAEKAATGKSKLGTTARGIGPCYADKVSRRRGIRVCDLYDPDHLRAALADIVAYKNACFATLFDQREPLDAATIADEYLDFGQQLEPYVTDTTTLLHDMMDDGERVLFEGAQGFMLDLDHGTYPYVTSSNAGAGGVSSGAGVPPHAIGQIIGVLKAYSTRVGEGPFPTEQPGEVGDLIRERGHEFGTTTGRPRRCGWFDAVAARYAARTTGPTGLAILHLDTLSGIGDLKICVGYKRNSEHIRQFPASPRELAEVEPVYETVPGWNDDLTGCRSYDELPQAARDYLQALAARIGVPVTMVGVGPDRAQTIMVEEPVQS